MVERLPRARGRGLGLVRHQPVRRQLADGISNERPFREHALRASRGRFQAAEVVEIAAHRRRISGFNAGQRLAPGTPDGRPGAGRAREQRHDLLGRRRHCIPRRQCSGSRLSGAHRLLEADEAVRAYLFALVLALAVPVAGAQVYKWVDEKGRMQYGDKPPAGVNATPIEPPPAPQGQPRPPQDLAAQEAEFRRRQIQKREEEEKLAREEKLRQQRCDQAKDRRALYERVSRISRFEKGERVYLSDEQRAAEVERLNAAVAQYCR